MGTVPAVQDHHTVPHIFDHHGYTLGGRCLSGTAYGNIADGNNAAVQLSPRQDTCFIQPQVHPGAETVNIGQAA